MSDENPTPEHDANDRDAEGRDARGRGAQGRNARALARAERARAREAAERAANSQASNDRPVGEEGVRAPDSDDLADTDSNTDRRIWWSLSAGGATVLVVFMILIWPVMQGRLDAVKQIDQAQALLTQAKGTIAPIDKLVNAQLSPAAAPTVPSVSAETLVARRELGQADRLISTGMPHLTEDEQKRARLLQTAIAARRTMIDRAPAILVASTKAVQAKAIADQGWQLANWNADTAALNNYDRHVASGVESASVAASVLKGRFAEARDLFSQAASAFPEAGLDRYAACADLKRRAMIALASASTLWLAHNLNAAGTAMSQCQALDDQAKAAFYKLPGAPGFATGQGFRTIAGASVDAYTKAKQQAAAADKALSAP